MPDTDGTLVTLISSSTFTVPTDLPEADGTLSWDSTTVVTVTVEAGGVTGLGWTYATGACRSVIEDTLVDAITGIDVMSVPACHEAMVRACRNQGRPGVVSCAISAVDIALWDCKAKILGVSLADLFGRCSEEISIYGSGGFTTYDDQTARGQLERWVGEWGTRFVKIKIGESWGACEARDIARTTFAREVIGNGVALFVDANGGYNRKQAVRVGRELAEETGVTWFEEPVSSDDLIGLNQIRQQVPLDVAAGEYGYDETYFARMVSADAVDCLQIDVTRCGGYTSWMRSAAMAGSRGLEVSAHCAPNLHAHVAVSVPHARHIEYFHDHQRLDSILFDGVLKPHDGVLVPLRDAPGHGMMLKEADAAKYRR